MFSQESTANLAICWNLCPSSLFVHHSPGDLQLRRIEETWCFHFVETKVSQLLPCPLRVDAIETVLSADNQQETKHEGDALRWTSLE
jgi:hypothetical protein